MHSGINNVGLWTKQKQLMSWVGAIACSLAMTQLPLFAEDTPCQAVTKLEQFSHVAGRISTVVSPTAIRIDIEKSAYIVASAPTWRVSLCNPTSQIALNMSFEQWMNHHPEWSFVTEDDWLTKEALLKTCSKKEFGHSCDEYCFANIDRQGRKFRKLNNTQGLATYLSDIAISDKACQIYWRAFNLPPSNLLPIECSILPTKSHQIKLMGAQAGKVRVLRTVRMQKIYCPRSLFYYPTNCKLVKRELEVVGTKAKLENSGSFLEFFRY